MGVKVREKVKGSGAWWVFVNHQGRRTSKQIGGKKEALVIAEEIRHQLARQQLGIIDKRENKTSFYDYSRYWLDNYIKPPMRSALTYRRYSDLLDRHIKAKIGSIPLVELSRRAIRSTLAGYYKSGAAKSSVGLMLCVISGALAHAVDDEIIASNPAAGVSKKLDLNRGRAREIRPLHPDQVPRILEAIAAEDSFYYPVFLTAFRTGLRAGELCALKWEDINIEGQYMQIKRTAKDQTVRKKLKTDAGRRRVDMSDQLTRALAEHRKKHDKETPWVFHKDGKLLSQNTLRRVFDRALGKAGIPHHRLHDIRHTYASILLSKGEPAMYVKEQLGHKSIQITVDIYGRWIPSANRDAVNALDDIPNTEYKTNLADR